MKQIIIIIFVTSITIGCNRTKQINLTEEQRIEKLRNENDSILIHFDSLLSLNVKLPQLMDTTVFSSECIDQFNRLAIETNGELKVVANSKFVSKVIDEIIVENGISNLDLMIIMDKTGSMSDDINNVKVGLSNILNSLKKFKNTRLSVATYGDRLTDGANWFSYKDFDTKIEDSKEFIATIGITGGGDYPESVYDGVYNAITQDFWKSNTKRIIILIGDAPSLVDKKTDHTIDEIISLAKTNEINMNFYPIVLSPYNTEYGTIETMQSLSFIESVFPNPSDGLVNIKMNQIGNFTLEVFDSDGTLIKTEPISSMSMTIELFDQKQGVYLIRVLDEKKNYDVKKIILR